MKKTILLAALFGLFAMTACNKADDPANDPAGDPSNPDRTQYLEYGLVTGDTVLHFYNVTAYYRDNNSQTVSEEITEREWHKRIQGWGDSLCLRVVYTLRDGADTSYSNSEWIYVTNNIAKIDCCLKYRASAYSIDRNGSTYTSFGDAPNSYMDASVRGFHLGERYWAGCTEMLNRKGDYTHTSLK